MCTRGAAQLVSILLLIHHYPEVTRPSGKNSAGPFVVNLQLTSAEPLAVSSALAGCGYLFARRYGSRQEGVQPEQHSGEKEVTE